LLGDQREGKTETVEEWEKQVLVVVGVRLVELF
jgi:hypothetical protein